MNQTVPPRLFVILAQKAPVGVIMRRGPSKWTRLCRWNTATDVMERGQWFQGRVYERRCDLSPDGRYFIYFAFNGQLSSEAKGNWTAISRPPYWTPLALWPSNTPAGGGGVFIANRTLYLHENQPALPGRAPRGIEVKRSHPFEVKGNAEDLGVYYPRLQRDGWTVTTVERREEGEVTHWARKSPKSAHRLIKRSMATTAEPSAARGAYYDEYALELPTGGVLEIAGAEWADWDHAGRLTFAREGKLLAATVGKDGLGSTQIADFNGEEPKNEPVPKWAREW